jgi:hypothetical protein
VGVRITLNALKINAIKGFGGLGTKFFSLRNNNEFFLIKLADLLVADNVFLMFY